MMGLHSTLAHLPCSAGQVLQCLHHIFCNHQVKPKTSAAQMEPWKHHAYCNILLHAHQHNRTVVSSTWATSCTHNCTRSTTPTLHPPPQVGGRCQSVTVPVAGQGTFRFDTGPSLLLFPGTYRSTFQDLGSELDQHVEIKRVNPAAYRCGAHVAQLVWRDTVRWFDWCRDV